MPRNVGRVQAGVLEPPASCHAPAADVDRDDEPVTQLSGESFESSWLRERGRSDNDTRGACGEELLRVGRGADPAGCLQVCRSGRFGKTADDARSDQAVASAVEVDDVD